MPVLPPVTIMTLPVRSGMSFGLHLGFGGNIEEYVDMLEVKKESMWRLYTFIVWSRHVAKIRIFDPNMP
jgi:hypothetical protein